MKRGIAKLLAVFVVFSILQGPTSGQLLNESMNRANAQSATLNSILTAGSNIRGTSKIISQTPNARLGQLRVNFESLRHQYDSFKSILSDEQLKRGADDLAELDEGLEIIGQLFDTLDETALEQAHLARTTQSLSQAVQQWCNKLRSTAHNKLLVW